MRAIVALVLALLVLAAGCGGGDDDGGSTTTTTTAGAGSGECESVDAPAPRDPETRSEATIVLLDTATSYALVFETNCGSFTIALDLEQAPNTSASLVALARDGYFDDTIFHRVVPDFVIQGGDPTQGGGGGPGYQTVDAPPPGSKYVKGVVAMAKTELEPAGTAGSQFFVVTGADIGLPLEYAVVGKVTEGLETVRAIDNLGVGDGPPSQPVVVESVTVRKS